MLRHKLITKIEIDEWEDFFYQLKANNYVVDEYEYQYPSNKKYKKNIDVGAFHLITINKKYKFYSIATNTGWKRSGSKGKIHSRVMYKLNDAGVQFIQDYIFMKNLGGEL